MKKNSIWRESVWEERLWNNSHFVDRKMILCKNVIIFCNVFGFIGWYTIWEELHSLIIFVIVKYFWNDYVNVSKKCRVKFVCLLLFFLWYNFYCVFIIFRVKIDYPTHFNYRYVLHLSLSKILMPLIWYEYMFQQLLTNIYIIL